MALSQMVLHMGYIDQNRHAHNGHNYYQMCSLRG